jgi:hypothetical protein
VSTDGLPRLSYREFLRATAATSDARSDTALASLLGPGEVAQARAFGAVVPNRAAELALRTLAKSGLVGGFATPVVHLRSLRHVIVTNLRVLVLADPSLLATWSAARADLQADRFTPSFAEGVLRIRNRDTGDIVIRLHAVGPWTVGAAAVAEALGAPPSRPHGQGPSLHDPDIFS